MEVKALNLLASASELLFKDANILVQIRDWFFAQAGDILLALIMFLIGRYAIKWIKAFAVRIMTKASYDSAAMSFITQIINYALLVGLILICLNQIGIPTTSFVAAFGAFGLGIGLALQNNLSNLASGLLILIFKPFRAGHVIQVGDVVGSVKSIQFMYTVITTKDKKNVYIPNSLLTSQAVTNIAYTTERVIPFVFDIGYNNDHHEAIKILKKIFANDKRVLNPKTMEIGISEFGENSVRIAAYAHVKSKDYPDVQYSIMSDVKDAFDKYGIDIPYPQRVVYIQNVDNSTGEIKGTKKKATGTNVAIDDTPES
ncbi:MAG: mechanosensitive ion channel family protein [Veillonella sp.]|nr:mechanosensitive ion channel family protein [Veillonella sp.]